MNSLNLFGKSVKKPGFLWIGAVMAEKYFRIQIGRLFAIIVIGKIKNRKKATIMNELREQILKVIDKHKLPDGIVRVRAKV
ncbi:hypothetical protein KAR10_04180, partial [bacterium]|nr:hypothetical protein [bacterium]